MLTTVRHDNARQYTTVHMGAFQLGVTCLTTLFTTLTSCREITTYLIA
jgi:hypothetical protein